MVIARNLMGFSFLVAVWQLRPGSCTAAGQCSSGDSYGANVGFGWRTGGLPFSWMV